MGWIVFFMLHVLAQYMCLGDIEDCNACRLDFMCCQGLCRPCFNCQLYLRQGGPCVCSLNDCGPCLEGYEEVSKTKFSYTLKACRIAKSVQNGTDKCTSDENCPKEKYCFSGRCVSCFDCKLYHREPSRFPCAKYPSDCGSCTEGYVEPAVTHYSKLKSCTIKTDYTKHKLLPEQQNFLFVLIIVIVGSGIFAVFFLRRHQKEALRSSVSEVERSTTYAPVPSPVYREEETVFTYIREDGEKSNATANVESSSESVHLPSSLDEEVINSPNSPINYDDEETIPSSWTPNPSVQKLDDNEISFNGIISRIRETKLTEPVEKYDEKSENVTSHPDNNVEMDEIETATQEIPVEEDNTES